MGFLKDLRAGFSQGPANERPPGGRPAPPPNVDRSDDYLASLPPQMRDQSRVALLSFVTEMRASTLAVPQGQRPSSEGWALVRAATADTLMNDRCLTPWVARSKAVLLDSWLNSQNTTSSKALANGKANALEYFYSTIGHTRADDVGRGIDALMAEAAYPEGFTAVTHNRDWVGHVFRRTDPATDELAIEIIGVVSWGLARIRTLGDFPFNFPPFDVSSVPGRRNGPGWYPNPLKAALDDVGRARLQRWWDGDWANDRVRVRPSTFEWQPVSMPLTTSPYDHA